MLRSKSGFIDFWSAVVMALTLASFITAVFVKGLTHDLLLEGAVFLVSAKLILMSYKSRLLGERIESRLDQIQAALRR